MWHALAAFGSCCPLRIVELYQPFKHAAGPARGYLPEHDTRIIAATPTVGGGESATVKFATSLLQPGARYAFFCTSPGHSTVMRGTFRFGDNGRLVRANAKTG